MTAPAGRRGCAADRGLSGRTPHATPTRYAVAVEWADGVKLDDFTFDTEAEADAFAADLVISYADDPTYDNAGYVVGIEVLRS